MERLVDLIVACDRDLRSCKLCVLEVGGSLVSLSVLLTKRCLAIYVDFMHTVRLRTLLSIEVRSSDSTFRKVDVKIWWNRL